ASRRRADVTSRTPPSRTPPRAVPGIAPPEDPSGDSYIRRAGRQLNFNTYAALRAVKLYPVENAAVQKALAELTAHTKELIVGESELEMKMSGEFIVVYQTRLRLDLDNFASFSHLLSLFRASGVGAVMVARTVAVRDWLIFLSLIQSPGTDDPTARLA